MPPPVVREKMLIFTELHIKQKRQGLAILHLFPQRRCKRTLLATPRAFCSLARGAPIQRYVTQRFTATHIWFLTRAHVRKINSHTTFQQQPNPKPPHNAHQFSCWVAASSSPDIVGARSLFFNRVHAFSQLRSFWPKPASCYYNSGISLVNTSRAQEYFCLAQTGGGAGLRRRKVAQKRYSVVWWVRSPAPSTRVRGCQWAIVDAATGGEKLPVDGFC